MFYLFTYFIFIYLCYLFGILWIVIQKNTEIKVFELNKDTNIYGKHVYPILCLYSIDFMKTLNILQITEVIFVKAFIKKYLIHHNKQHMQELLNLNHSSMLVWFVFAILKSNFKFKVYFKVESLIINFIEIVVLLSGTRSWVYVSTEAQRGDNKPVIASS